MGLLGVVKEDDNVFVINESLALMGAKSQVIENNLQTWVPDGLKHTLLACDCNLGKVQIIKGIGKPISKLEESRGICKDYLLKCLTPQVISLFYRLGVVEEEPLKDLNASLVIASKDKAFFLGNKGTIREINKLDFFCYGGDFLVTAMEQLAPLNVIDRLKAAIYKYNDLINVVHFPVLIRDTKSLSKQFFTYDECKETYEHYMYGEEK